MVLSINVYCSGFTCTHVNVPCSLVILIFGRSTRRQTGEEKVKSLDAAQVDTERMAIDV